MTEYRSECVIVFGGDCFDQFVSDFDDHSPRSFNSVTIDLNSMTIHLYLMTIHRNQLQFDRNVALISVKALCLDVNLCQYIELLLGFFCSSLICFTKKTLFCRKLAELHL